MKEDIQTYDGNKLLNTPDDDLTSYFVKKYEVEIPSLREDLIVSDQRECQIDVSQDRMRAIMDRSRPVMVPGTEVEITIPFEGEAEAFHIQPSSHTLSPPTAEVHETSLAIHIRGTDLKPESVRSSIDQTISEINNHLQNLRNDSDGFNQSLEQLAETNIRKRKEKLLSDQDLVSSLGFPIKERQDAPKTYSAPDVKRKIRPKPPAASSAPYHPEPVLDESDYEHILGVIENMAHVMERSPSAFSNMDEEDLRTHFLVQLNGHFEGKATGETFNYSGKTDILVRDEDKNIFIGECKFWGGPKQLAATIDQILSYSSWRDTKVAILVFNKNRNFSAILGEIPPTAEAHPNYKRTIKQDTETRFRYVFSNQDDTSRELTLTILAFDVPN